ncbi:MAG: hypothetical protein R3E09_13560 [Novosphingobium sp.]
MQYYTRYEGIPVPPVKENMEVFEAGAISIGVEFRVLTDELLESLGLKEVAAANGINHIDEVGVSLHIFARTSEGMFERLRFDCFGGEPHYHYISVPNKTQDGVLLDPNAIGDPLAWSLATLANRIVQMLARADVADAANLVDHARLEAVMPQVIEAAYRARFHADQKNVAEAAMAVGEHEWDTSENRSWTKHSQI